MPPQEVKSGNIARCFGSALPPSRSWRVAAPRLTLFAASPGTDPALGHPVEFIVLNDTSAEFPAVCKYCGNRFYSAPHAH